MKYERPEMEIIILNCVPITQLSTEGETSTVPGVTVPDNGIF